MKALGVSQPYAWLIVHGYKKVEYRTWLTHFQGHFFVHANKAIDKDKLELVRSQKAKDGIYLPAEFPRGGIVGVVKLTKCVPTDDLSGKRRLLDRLFRQPSPCGDQPDKICYGFILEDPQPLPFVPYSGKQKFFNVPDDLYGEEFDF